MYALSLILLAAAPAAVSATTPTDAARVVRDYYAAIDARRYRDAYAAWERVGQASGKSYAQFARGFARTTHSRVVTGAPVDADAGMGQRWITVPVDVFATLANGTRQHFRGRYVLHRVADIDGATDVQRRWHLYRGALTLVAQ